MQPLLVDTAKNRIVGVEPQHLCGTATYNPAYCGGISSKNGAVVAIAAVCLNIGLGMGVFNHRHCHGDTPSLPGRHKKYKPASISRISSPGLVTDDIGRTQQTIHAKTFSNS